MRYCFQNIKHEVAIFLMVLAFILMSAYATSQILTRAQNMPLSSDSIIIYQEPFIEVSDSGRNRTWDYSFFDEEIPIGVNYYAISSLENSVYGRHQAKEHILYQEKSDTIYVIGYVNALRKVECIIPEPIMKFPFQYEDTIVQNCIIKETWGHKFTNTSNVTTYVKADATGTLVLPTMNIDSTLRVYTRKEYKTFQEDTISLSYHSWKWFSPMYRHPIVEIIKVMNGDSISMAYTLYNPANILRKRKPKASPATHSIDVDNELHIVSCFPNPVEKDLTVHYNVNAVSTVSFVLYSSSGICVYRAQLEKQQPDMYNYRISMGSLSQGTYTLYVGIGSEVIGKEIIKK